MTLVTNDSGLALDQTEQLTVVHDRASGLGAAIAIDDTTLGPAIGGVRWRQYPDEPAAITEARRLARVMTLKSALAGIPSGGGKSVVFRPTPAVRGAERRSVMEAFGRVVERLGGLYVPGLDMGTSLEDLRAIGTQAAGICVIEPSEQTAIAVFAGILAAVEVRWGTGLSGKRVLVQGAGHVGADLAARLTGAGARVTLADVDAQRVAALAGRIGASVIDPADVLHHSCDIFAPCAIGRLVDRDTVPRLRCEVIAGAANDVLAHHEAADLLLAHEIDYVPDFLINSGGVVAIYAKRAGWEAEQLAQAVGAIGHRVREVLERARRTARTPLAIAEDLASERLGHSVTVPD